MMQNLNSAESAEAVEHIGGDHGDFGVHESIADGRLIQLYLIL